MRLSDQQLHNEQINISIMTQVKKLLKMGLISEAKELEDSYMNHL